MTTISDSSYSCVTVRMRSRQAEFNENIVISIPIMKMIYSKFHNTIRIFILIARTNQFRITIDSHRLDFALLRKNGKGCIFKFTYRYKKEKLK